jgi:chromosome partitioning protein
LASNRLCISPGRYFSTAPEQRSCDDTGRECFAHFGAHRQMQRAIRLTGGHLPLFAQLAKNRRIKCYPDGNGSVSGKLRARLRLAILDIAEAWSGGDAFPFSPSRGFDMPTITFANTKGGAGKTTVALIVATELARRGHRVAIVDGDPQQWAGRWYELTGPVAHLSLVTDVTDETIERQIKEVKKRADYVIIDLPGGLNTLLAKAIGMSDHVFIPVQGCAMDAVGGAQVLELLQALATQSDIRIPHAVVLTRINSIITTRALSAVKVLLAERQVRLLDTPLVERAAYRDMFNAGGTLSSLNPMYVSNLDKALVNAQRLADEILLHVPLAAAKPKLARKRVAPATRAA